MRGYAVGMAHAGPLALVGGAELQPGNEEQDRLLVAAAGAGPAYVIVTAAVRHDPDAAVTNAAGWFGSLGLAVEELPMRTPAQCRDASAVERARAGRFFYLVGGDPGYTAQTLRGSPAWGAIEEAWRGGAALGGSSAGAMALGAATLLRGRHPGDRERRYAEAIGLVPELGVIPHYETFGHEWRASAEADRPSGSFVLLGIDERSAAVWREGRWTAAGPGRVLVIRPDGDTSFDSGAHIQGLPQPRGVEP